MNTNTGWGRQACTPQHQHPLRVGVCEIGSVEDLRVWGGKEGGERGKEGVCGVHVGRGVWKGCVWGGVLG